MKEISNIKINRNLKMTNRTERSNRRTFNNLKFMQIQSLLCDSFYVLRLMVINANDVYIWLLMEQPYYISSNFSHKIKYSRNKNVDFNISTKDLPLFFILCFFHPWCLEFLDSQMYEYCKWSTKFRMNRRTKKKWSAYVNEPYCEWCSPNKFD